MFIPLLGCRVFGRFLRSLQVQGLFNLPSSPTIICWCLGYRVSRFFMLLQVQGLFNLLSSPILVCWCLGCWIGSIVLWGDLFFRLFFVDLHEISNSRFFMPLQVQGLFNFLSSPTIVCWSLGYRIDRFFMPLQVQGLFNLLSSPTIVCWCLGCRIVSIVLQGDLFFRLFFRESLCNFKLKLLLCYTLSLRGDVGIYKCLFLVQAQVQFLVLIQGQTRVSLL